MIYVAISVAVLLFLSVALVLVRIVRGPSTLDRIVATDALLAITLGAIATEAAYSRDATGLPVLVGLSLLGFAGSVSVARFGARPPAPDAELPTTGSPLVNATIMAVPVTTAGAVADTLAAACLLCGAILSFAAGVGLLRFPDVPARMHAATKPQVLGLLLILTGAALRLGTVIDITTLVLVGVFQLATAPVATHMVARSAYRGGYLDRNLLLVDELADLRSNRPAHPPSD